MGEPNSNLLDNFIGLLHQKIKKRSELVRFVADALKIERESASRRLKGKVLFTVREIGILAMKLEISLDSLIRGNKSYGLIPLRMDEPFNAGSLDVLMDRIEEYLPLFQELCKSPAEVGVVYDTLPIEFYIPFPNLCKFMYYRWEHHFVGRNKLVEFNIWQLPERVIKYNQAIINICKKCKTIIYIGDPSTIQNLINEIQYFKDIYLVDESDVNLIKKDLHEMLKSLEETIIGGEKEKAGHQEIYFYISNINVGSYFTYHLSSSAFFCTIRAQFVQSIISEGYEVCFTVRNWINSMRKISTLISDSGEKGRRIFFQKQHKIVDMI